MLRDVADAGLDLGLGWDPSAVSRIETGRRDLTLEEFVALPLVLTLALDEVVTLGDLLEDDEATTAELLPLLGEPYMTLYKVPGWTLARDYVRDELDRWKRHLQAKREPDEVESLEELKRVAAELDVTVGAVFDAMRELWDYQTLRSERERRLVEAGEDLSNPAHIRTIRGHITRQMMQELRDYFAAKAGTPAKADAR